MKKPLKILVIVSLCAIFIIGAVFQYRAESYLARQRDHYGILQHKSRVSYCPILLFYIMHEIGGMNPEVDNDEVTASLYSSNIDFKNLKDTLVISHNSHEFYDRYVAYIFYTKEEIDSIISDTIVKDVKLVY